MKRAGISGARIDWAQVRNRLRANERALEEALSPTPHRIEEVYRQRAALLAQGAAEYRPAMPGIPALLFSIGQERYAVDVKEVAEVVAFKNCVAVPDASSHWMGIVNLRGEFCAVLDLGRLLTRSASTEKTERGFILIPRQRGRVGWKVDGITGVFEVGADAVIAQAPSSYIRALVTLRGAPNSNEPVRFLDTTTVLQQMLAGQES